MRDLRSRRRERSAPDRRAASIYAAVLALLAFYTGTLLLGLDSTDLKSLPLVQLAELVHRRRVLVATVQIGSQGEGPGQGALDWFEQSQRSYAARHGYTYRKFTTLIDPNISQPLDPTLADERAFAVNAKFQRLLICEHTLAEQFDLVLYVDRDIFILDHARGVPTGVELGPAIGMVPDAQPSMGVKRVRALASQEYFCAGRSARPDAQETPYPCSVNEIEQQYYQHHGLRASVSKKPAVFNSGVMLLQPKKGHCGVLRSIYDTYRATAVSRAINFTFGGKTREKRGSLQ